MKKSIALALVAAAGLAGCAHGPHHREYGKAAANPVIGVEGDQVKVPEVLGFPVGVGPITITWRLDPKAGVRFADRGITVEGRITNELIRGDKVSAVLDARQDTIIDCKAADEARQTYTCTNTTNRAGAFKYTIRLTDGKRDFGVDPIISNW
jgi:hypothetical protein